MKVRHFRLVDPEGKVLAAGFIAPKDSLRIPYHAEHVGCVMELDAEIEVADDQPEQLM
jgi:hypothetical protein